METDYGYSKIYNVGKFFNSSITPSVPKGNVNFFWPDRSDHFSKFIIYQKKIKKYKKGGGAFVP